MLLKNILVLLHVIAAAGWFGLALILGAVSRKAEDGDGAGLRDVGSKVERLMTIFIVLTFIFGFGALFAGGGFAVYGPLYHTSLLLIFILVLVQFFVIRRGWASIASASGGSGSHRTKVSMGIGVGHLIWLVVLVMMFWNHYPLW